MILSKKSYSHHYCNVYEKGYVIKRNAKACPHIVWHPLEY